MFDIGFSELLLVAVISLLVLGPERLPGAVRTASTWLRSIRRSFNEVRDELEREINTAELERDLDDYNKSILKQISDTGAELNHDIEAARSNLQDLQADVEKPLREALDEPGSNKPHADRDV